MAQNGRFWIGTVPGDSNDKFEEKVQGICTWVKGQKEVGEGGYAHWQIIVGFSRNVRLSYVKKMFDRRTHWELTRSAAADEYVWKEETRVEGTQFEFGQKPIRRNNSKDWDGILEAAKKGNFDKIPSDVLVRCYSQVCRIAKDFMEPVAFEKDVFVFWGRTGTGKSRTAWERAGLQAYPKDPNTKWWDGYRGQEDVVIDEFRGKIAIEHLLRWLDRYPVIVESKGGAIVLRARRLFFTSNISPDDWYVGLDEGTVNALKRRIKVTHFC